MVTYCLFFTSSMSPSFHFSSLFFSTIVYGDKTSLVRSKKYSTDKFNFFLKKSNNKIEYAFEAYLWNCNKKWKRIANIGRHINISDPHGDNLRTLSVASIFKTVLFYCSPSRGKTRMDMFLGGSSNFTSFAQI